MYSKLPVSSTTNKYYLNIIKICMMNIIRLLLLMPTLASVAYSQTTNANASALEDIANRDDTTNDAYTADQVADGAAEVADGAVAASTAGTANQPANQPAASTAIQVAAADIVSGLPNCTQYKIDFNTDNCICNRGDTCIDKKSYYETFCINNC
jgi:hypothetical protein